MKLGGVRLRFPKWIDSTPRVFTIYWPKSLGLLGLRLDGHKTDAKDSWFSTIDLEKPKKKVMRSIFWCPKFRVKSSPRTLFLCLDVFKRMRCKQTWRKKTERRKGFGSIDLEKTQKVMRSIFWFSRVSLEADVCHKYQPPVCIYSIFMHRIFFFCDNNVCMSKLWNQVTFSGLSRWRKLR
jgi:hypothetical protein